VPIYEYRCLEKGHTFEALQKLQEPPLERCRICGAPVERLISQPVQLRNAGIYIFDRTGRDLLHDV